MHARRAPAPPARQSRAVAAPAPTPAAKHARALAGRRAASLLPTSRAPLSPAPTALPARRRRRAPAPAPAAAASAAAAGPSPAESPLASLQQAVPVDRLRYQALLVFNYFDTDRDGAFLFFAPPAPGRRCCHDARRPPPSVSLITKKPKTHQTNPIPTTSTKTGVLNAAEYAAYSRYAANKAPWAPAVGAALAAAAAPLLPPPAAAGPPGGSGRVGREAFVSIVRAQLARVSASPGGPLDAPGAAGLVPQEVARLAAQSSLTRGELLAARWAFLLIDLDNDNRVRLEDVRRAGGIERAVAEARGLFDDEEDEDEEEGAGGGGAGGGAAAAAGGAAASAGAPASAAGAKASAAAGLVSFEEYLATYSRPKEPFKAAAVLLANTVLVWLIVQAPCDLLLRGAAIAALLIKPQIVARPVVWVHDLILGLINGARARAELARRQRGGR